VFWSQIMHVNPVIFTLTVILIIVYFFLRRRRMAAEGGSKPRKPSSAPAAPRPPKPERPPEEVFMDLRRQALATPAETVGMTGQFGPDEPFGVVMEMWLSDSVVSLACFANGDASFVFKTGGGMVGGGVHEAVRKAAQAFVAVAEKAWSAMSPATDVHPLPDRGQVRFYVLTPRGVVTTETDREALGEAAGSPLAALFYSGQEVVTQMRQVQEQRAR
jgi:hypothetical protein